MVGRPTVCITSRASPTNVCYVLQLEHPASREK